MFTFWIAILCLPMLTGQWLAGPYSDQLSAGVPFRGWGAEWWRKLGHIPLWNPEIFAGMPYVGALGTGDILYPTAAVLRLLLPTATAINIGFFVHYVLAGLFTYLFLRRLGVSWSGSLIAGLAYQLSGVVASYVQPGHDGKLVVTALMPLVLLGLVLAIRDRRPAGFALVAIGVAFSIFTQHVQMTYYMLLTAGLFALYLALAERPRLPVERVKALALAFGAVALGFGIAAIQLLPAFAHMPLSPRAEGVQGGFEVATSYAIPWAHVPEFFLKWFVGQTETYWSTNGIKLHSEYLGLPVIALAIWGAGTSFVDRRLRFWLGSIGLLFLLVGLGSGTPFYRLWFTLMPYVKQMRAPGMSFFVVAFVVACFAGFGVERWERRSEDQKAPGRVRTWLIAAAVIALLGMVGVFGNMARALSVSRASAVAPREILLGAITSALALAAVAAILWAGTRQRLRAAPTALLLALIIGGDLWINARPFWMFTTLHKTLYAPDPIVERIKAGPSPTRVLDLSRAMGQSSYPGNVLMSMNVPQLLGEHGLELRYFDDVMGGHNTWRNLGNPHLWDMFAVRWVITPSRVQGLDSIPGFKRVVQGQTASGAPIDLYERTAPVPYAQVVSAAVAADSGPILATLIDARMGFDRLVLLNTRDGVTARPVNALPEPSPSKATIKHWEPGRMSITLDPAPPDSSYLVVSENWYPDWRAQIDGKPGRVLRGNWTLITVPVPSGARQIDLTFVSAPYQRGKLITLLCSLVAVGIVIGPAIGRHVRERRAPPPAPADPTRA